MGRLPLCPWRPSRHTEGGQAGDATKQRDSGRARWNGHPGSGTDRCLVAWGVVKDAIILASGYALLSLLDLAYSLAAFASGVPEGNPVLAWLQGEGLFIPAKLGLTLAACVLILALYRQRAARYIAWGAVLVMVAVNLVHVIGLTVQGVL